MKWILAFSIVLLVQMGMLHGQSLVVYPGDVTNNGVVNNLDFLHLGMVYNFAGAPRDSNSVTFEPLPASPWSYQFASGLNAAYADCNGDGVVNYYYDAFPLYSHYGKQRSSGVVPDVFTAGLSGIDPQLHFDHTQVPTQVQGGQMINLPIELGTLDNSIEDLYGIAFSLVVDPQLIDVNSVMFNLSEISWANPDNDRIWIYKKVSNKRVDVAWVRTDQNQKRGFGRIGSVDFVIIVDIVPLQLQQFPVRLEDIKMMDKFGNYTPIAGDTAWLTVPADSALSGTRLPPNEPRVSVMPNPASDKLFLQSSDPITGMAVIDVLGQIVFDERIDQSYFADINLPKLVPGTYLLRVETETGALFKLLTVDH